MLTVKLHDVDEPALRALERDGIPEVLMIEYKRELHLSKKDQRREAAKDVSAMANTVGGHIVYGLDEKVLPDGTHVAGPIVPMVDGTVIEALANVLHSAIHPRPSFDMARVAVSGGFALIVEVHRSYADLHMVTAYDENRYYRRGPTGVVPMTEHEVRDAYAQILTARASLDAREKQLLEPEIARREKTDESIVIIPLYGHDLLFDPRSLTITEDLDIVFEGEGEIAREIKSELKIQPDGLRASVGGDYLYLALLKGGVIHLSFNEALTQERKDTEYDFSSLRALRRILKALALARRVFEQVGYRGPVRVRYYLRAPGPFIFDRNPLTFRPVTAQAGTYTSGLVDGYFSRGSIERMAKELLDPIFHIVGKATAPHFTPDGRLKDEIRKDLPAGIARLLD
jgi:schlafen family protein